MINRENEIIDVDECSFCLNQGKRLIRGCVTYGVQVYVCDECVRVLSEIIKTRTYPDGGAR